MIQLLFFFMDQEIVVKGSKTLWNPQTSALKKPKLFARRRHSENTLYMEIKASEINFSVR